MTPYDRYENAYTALDVFGDGYIVIFKPNDHWCMFTIWEVMLQPNGSFLYDGCQMHHDLSEVPHLITGTVNWDGCANYSVDDGPIHVCDVVMLRRVTSMLEWCYGKALTMIEYVDTQLLEED